MSTRRTCSGLAQVHTTANPGGEIRGQVLFGNVGVAALNGGSEVPAVSGVSGSGTLGSTFTDNGRSLMYSLTVANLTGPVTGAHFHGPAGPTGTNGVLFVITGLGGSNTSVSGVWRGLTAEQIGWLTTGQVYVLSLIHI